jgi:hypothetical protein
MVGSESEMLFLFEELAGSVVNLLGSVTPTAFQNI